MWKKPCGVNLEESQPTEEPTLGILMKDCIPIEGAPNWSRVKCEEGVAKMNCYELTATLIPHPPVPHWVGADETENLRKRKKVESEEKAQTGGSCS